MFRLFIIISFLHVLNVNYAQTSKRELKYLLKRNIEQEDYVDVAKYYDTLTKTDSLDYELLESFANILIQIKDFKRADLTLKKLCNIYENKNLKNHSVYYKLGLVNKQLGQYDESLKYFTTTLSILNKKINKSLYTKVEQEISSCMWAKTHLKDSTNYTINKFHTNSNQDSEFGHAIIGNQLIISTLNCSGCSDSTSFKEEGYTNKIYSVSKINGKELKEVKQLNSSINHSSNGTFSSDKKQFYFSSCNNLPNNKKCKILVSKYNNGTWEIPDTMRGEINDNNFTYTMPAFGKIQGKDYLFFCSDSKNSIGGLDIFYGIINQNALKEIKPIQFINSIEDDISPFYDNENSTLYFASAWFNGFGGYDLFKTIFNPKKSSKIENLGMPFNSANNDVYIIKDSLNYFITSNRNHAALNQNCCNDIYKLKPYYKKSDTTHTIASKDEKTTSIHGRKNIENLEKLTPISLYFHNDIPNPKSIDSITTINYEETYNDYNQLLEIYKSKYSEGLNNETKINAELGIKNFFIHNLQKGRQDLDAFLEILIDELKNGQNFELIFKGYASPLAKNEYNKLLSKRRISSVKNYIAFYKNGIFLNYLIADKNGETKLSFKEESFGEYLSDKLVSDNPNDKKNSIFSINAAMERKVEIIGFKIK